MNLSKTAKNRFFQRTATAITAISTLCLAACSDSSGGNAMSALAGSPLMGCADIGSCASNPPLQVDAERPAQVHIPADYNTSTRYPLVILLHGFGVNGAIQAAYMGLVDRVESQQFVLVAPDGTENAAGARFWNATEACCAFSPEDKTVDDVAYIRGLIEKAAATYSIDPARVGLIGHSNGGFMSLRMACEVSELVTSVVSLAGSTFAEASSCAPAINPVSVLTLHGTRDDTILYDGLNTGSDEDGDDGGRIYPSAPETIRRFAALAECAPSPVMQAELEVLPTVPGPETDVFVYGDCAPGVDVEFWSMVDGPHIPLPWEQAALDRMVDWVITHSRVEWR